jgi:DNA-binding PadR family transcriptional regulator
MQKPSERLKRKIERENLWIFTLSLLKNRKLCGIELKTSIEKKFKFRTGATTVYKILYILERGKICYIKKNR